MRYSIPRKSRRVPLSTLVNLKLERLSGAVTEITSDLSLGGMFVPSDTPAEIGSLVAFEFKVGEDLVEGTGEVVWVRTDGDGPERPPGMGIRFRYLSPGSRERIFRLVQRYASDGDDALVVPNTAPIAEITAPEAAERVPAPAESAPRVSAADLAFPPVRSEFDLPELPSRDEAPVQEEAIASFADAPSEEASSDFAVAPPAGELPRPAETVPEFQIPERAEPEAADLPEVPNWLRPDPPDMPDLPVAPESETVSAADLAGGYRPGPSNETSDETGTQATGQYQVQGAGYSGGRSRGGFKINWRLFLFGSLIGLALLAAAYRFGQPLLNRNRGETEPTQKASVLPPISESSRPTQPATSEGGAAAPPTEPAQDPAAAAVTDPSTTAPATGQDAAPDPVPDSAQAAGADAEQAARDGAAEPAAGDPEPVSEPATEPAVATPIPAPPEPPPPAVPSRPMNQVSEIRVRTVSEGTLVAIETNGAIADSRYRRIRLEAAPPRELIRMNGVDRAYKSNAVAANTNELRGVRIGLHPGGELHVVLDLASAAVQVASTDVVGRELRILLRTP